MSLHAQPIGEHMHIHCRYINLTVAHDVHNMYMLKHIGSVCTCTERKQQVPHNVRHMYMLNHVYCMKTMQTHTVHNLDYTTT